MRLIAYWLCHHSMSKQMVQILCLLWLHHTLHWSAESLNCPLSSAVKSKWLYSTVRRFWVSLHDSRYHICVKSCHRRIFILRRYTPLLSNISISCLHYTLQCKLSNSKYRPVTFSPESTPAKCRPGCTHWDTARLFDWQAGQSAHPAEQTHTETNHSYIKHKHVYPNTSSYYQQFRDSIIAPILAYQTLLHNCRQVPSPETGSFPLTCCSCYELDELVVQIIHPSHCL